MSTVLREKWLWIIIVSLILIVVVPFLVVWFILTLPPALSFVATILVLVSWGVAAGYKDWLIHKKSEEEKQKKSETF